MLHHLVGLLLASASVNLCSLVHREYHLISEKKNWTEAQDYCRKHYTDLSTVGSHDEKLLANTTQEIWIGLIKTEVESWMWSVGQTQTSSGLVEYTNWASLPESSHHCGGIRNDGKWSSALCDTLHPFICQEGEGSNGMHVVLQEKSWRDALKHCRLNNTDLASVKSETENQAFLQKVSEMSSSLSLVWMGLFRDNWKWSDMSSSSFRDWDDSQPNNDGDCALYRPSGKQWWDRECESQHPFSCYRLIAAEKMEEKVTRHILKLQFKSDSDLDLNNPTVSQAILDQIQKEFPGAKLRWRVPPDGKIFIKKEEKESKSECDG